MTDPGGHPGEPHPLRSLHVRLRHPGPINQAFYEECGQDLYNSDAEYFCTNGAYVMTEWVHDSQMVLTKNPNYRNKDSLPVDTLNFRIISDGQTALTSFLAGELDMTELGTQQILQQAEDAGYETTAIPTAPPSTPW